MNLLDSLLDAIVRLDGDALVMHVGEKPYVVTTSEAANQFRGPLAWGQVELSTRVLTPDAIVGMLGQILPLDQRSALDEYGATEYQVTAVKHPEERFTVVAARGGDDIWVEMRRQPVFSAEAAAVIAELREDAALTDVAPDGVAVAAADAVAVAPPDQGAEVAAPLTRHDRTAGAAGPPPSAVPAAAVEQAEEPRFEIASGPALMARADASTDAVAAPPGVAPSGSADIQFDAEQPPDFELVPPEPEDPLSLDSDSDRDLTEELLSLEADFDGGMFAGATDWHDDVMTEGELGELLRATAAAVIAAEMGAEEPVAIGIATAADAPLAVEALPYGAPLPGDGEQVEPGLAAAGGGGDEPIVIERQVVRILEELPVLVAHQIEHDRLASQRSYDEVPSISNEQHAAVESTGDEDGPQPLADSSRIEVRVAIEEDREDRSEALASVDMDLEANEDVTAARPPAVVVPLTRHSKGDAADARGSVAATLQRVLRLAAARGAGTVYVVAQSAPLLRVDGEFSTLEGEPPLSAAFVERLLSEVAPSSGGESPSADWLIDVPEIGRVRCVTFRDHRGPGAIFRMVPARAISADQLGLSAEVQGLCSEADGLVLVTGTRGSGKSTLLTSFVDLINRTRSDHIISIESQIDFVHEPKRSFISQREVRGEDAMVAAVRGACREEPDVLIIEDLHTQELAALALDAAESGRLVFASVHGVSTASALERLIELFPAERREKVQASLAGTLRGIVSQVLLRKLRGGRVAAREVLLNTPAVASLIMEGKTFQLPASLESGRGAGMMSFAESLASLVREGAVHPAHAHRKAPNRDQFLAALRRNGVDPALAERLA